jgi:glycosyltransferase involved in cell wall biosynthesis
MGRADVVVVPSSEPEPFGMVVVEGMALGRPVIATNAGGPAEIINDKVDGLLVPPKDPEALADAIEWLRAHRAAARQIGASARERAQQFDPARACAVVLDVYEQLAGRDVPLLEVQHAAA